MGAARPECNRKVKRRTGSTLRDLADAFAPCRTGSGAPIASVRIRPILRALTMGVWRLPTAPTAWAATALVVWRVRIVPPEPSPGLKPVIVDPLTPCQYGSGVPIASVRIQPILRALTKGLLRSLATPKVPAPTSERTLPYEGLIADRWAAAPWHRALHHERTLT